MEDQIHDTPSEITIKDLTIATGMPTRKIMYRIKIGKINARKLGWQWLIPYTEIERVKKSMKKKKRNK